MKTTIILSSKLLKSANQLSRKQGKTRSRMIADLIIQSSYLPSDRARLNKGVQYQRTNTNDEMVLVHLSLEDHIFQYCQDVRNFMKISVSAFISRLISKVLQESSHIDSRNKKSDNYLSFSYVFIQHYTQEDSIFIISHKPLTTALSRRILAGILT